MFEALRRGWSKLAVRPVNGSERLEAEAPQAASTAQPTLMAPEAAPTGSVYATMGAQTDEEARGRYRETKENDPFPEIAPALLNSAHIEDYMLATAMVFPYQSERRKSASYAMRLGSEIAFWDPIGPERELPVRQLRSREMFVLPPNSLVYVQTKELFQLPNYMAVRFNLHIDLVHKGLLLGTGPLVDPGFRGHLMIPLHNMTANTYVLAEDDELIWVEFTKTSLKPEWQERALADPNRPRPSADFERFPKDKSNKRMFDYFERALTPHDLRTGDRPYQFPANAIPKAVAEAQRTADSAKEDARRSRLDADKAAGSAMRIRNWGIGTILAVGLALVTLIWVTMQMVQATVSLADTTAERVRGLSDQVATLRREVANRDAAWAQTALVDFCTVNGVAPQARADRARLSTRAAAAEKVANASASAAGLRDPFPKPLLATSDPSPDACTIR